jgi:hypothetical protein
MFQLSRRGFTGLLFGSLLHRFRVSGQSSPAEPRNPPRVLSRKYRADAVILLLGLPIYKRAGVGTGQTSVEETGEGESLRRTFFFAGGSDPARARGLSRLGWMREVIAGPGSAPAEATYFGVLTSSPEESLEHARKSTAPVSGRSTFSAANGKNTVGRSRSAVTHFEFNAGAVWSDRALIEQAQSTFQSKVDWRETSWPNWTNQAPPTFLYQIATLLEQKTPRAAGRYVYSEQEYSLELQTGRSRDRLVPVHGKIRNLRTNEETPFRLWLEEGSDSIVPVRIEYQPRSFLRLTFEAVSA